MSYPIQVFAVVIHDDEILTTVHDRGLGAFWGLPGEWVAQGDSFRTVVEEVVIKLTTLNVKAGRLLAAENIFHSGYDSLLIAFECSITGMNTPIFQGTAHISDDSITHCGWTKISDFMDAAVPLIEWDFWIRSVQVQHGELAVDLHETDFANLQR